MVIPVKLESRLLSARLSSALDVSIAAAVFRHPPVFRRCLIGLLSLSSLPGSAASMMGENCAEPTLPGDEGPSAFECELGEAAEAMSLPLSGNVEPAINRSRSKVRASEVDIPRYLGANMRGS